MGGAMVEQEYNAGASRPGSAPGTLTMQNPCSILAGVQHASFYIACKRSADMPGGCQAPAPQAAASSLC